MFQSSGSRGIFIHFRLVINIGTKSKLTFWKHIVLLITFPNKFLDDFEEYYDEADAIF